MKSPPGILFWLLVAATAAVDVVAIAWLVEGGPSSQAVFLYDGLVTGQLSVVCIWSVLGSKHMWTAWAAALMALGAAVALNVRVVELSLAEACGIYGTFVALLVLSLWTLEHLKFWRQIAGSVPGAAWQYSTFHLLAAMTIVALLIVALRGSSLLMTSEVSWQSFAMLTIGDVVLAVATLVVWQWSTWQTLWWPRLAAVCVPALAIGALEISLALSGALGDYYEAVQVYSPFGMVAYTLVVSIVIFAYLELAPIVDRPRVSPAPPDAGTSP
jgi:hypothetical protein